MLAVGVGPELAACSASYVVVIPGDAHSRETSQAPEIVDGRYQHATTREVEGICRSLRRAAYASWGAQWVGSGRPVVPRSPKLVC